jgi:hypothetical protein
MKHFWTILLCCAAVPASAQWRDLLPGGKLDNWEVRGDGTWTVLKDGVLLGQRPHPTSSFSWPIDQKQWRAWASPQAWLYTRAEFDEFDLRLDYFLPPGGNSGISIRDSSRARWAISGPEWDAAKTPSHIGYEVQLLAGGGGKYPSGSIYLIAPAAPGKQRANDWNTLEIESRRELIRVKINGAVTAESPGEPARPKAGPIGLQLHDRFSWAMFRNIAVRPAGRR